MALECVDVLVIGAGPSGLAAAIALKSLGVRDVLVVDREESAGGVPRHCEHTGFGLRDMRRVLSGPAYAHRCVREAQAAGVQIRTGVTVTEWTGPRQVRTTSPAGIGEIRAGAIVLATGCRERPRAARLIPGSRPDGIYTTGSLQRFVHDYGHPVGTRAVVIGAEHVSYSAVHTLRSCGIPVAAMVTRHARHQSYEAFIRIAQGFTRVPLHTGTRLTNILGRGRVQAVEITHTESGAVQEIACDTVVFTGDWIPDREVARKAGLALDEGTLGPAVDAGLRTSREGVFAVGNLVHPGETADTAALSGRAAAVHVAAYLKSGGWRGEGLTAIDYDPNVIQWVAPGLWAPGPVTGPESGGIFRVARVIEKAVVSLSQGGRVLWRRRYRRLVPNLPYALPDSMHARVDPEGGALQVTVTPPGDSHLGV